MSELQVIENHFKEIFKANGFKKKRRTWFRDHEEVIAVFNIQISSYTNEVFYLNLGVYVKALGKVRTPQEYECHVRSRLSKLLGKREQEELERLCDFRMNPSMGVEERASRLGQMVTENALPFFSRLTTLKAIADCYRSNETGTTVQLRQLIEESGL